MGRRPAFDAAPVVTAARDMFWQRGFDETSLPDLEQATGLSRSSIYHAFGSKRGLFDAAVADYLACVVAPRLTLLSGPDGVDAYFASLARDIASSGTQRRGCLLITTAATSAAHDETLAVVVNAYREALTEAIGGALTARGDADVETRSRVLVTMSVGALLQARVDRTEALAVIDAARTLARGWESP
ncbi:MULTISPECIES: TetR/AcrR family transcriptional regulator [Nocardiaceae]|uniref:AcrR family transcriptional regulator n=1 Tax=Rhodococcoides corynebacterioides TaxID=53972 RepID=A0ABS2KZS2_9NOCA|nr:MULTISPECIES: TetR/AcrR family transcriptional regulator [Rhodococcus]MBM7416776.1 AcrR family transcriptional regulator [Rhodococcus corynebacterioides]MBP1115029.1 AcrR family transcriptional regulator [Rhodococcus sp. PvP016]